MRGESWPGESSAANDFSGAGELLDSDCLKGETLEEHARNFIPRTIGQALYQIQQELLAVRAQLLHEFRCQSQNNASDNLTTAQTHEGTPNPVDVNGQDRPSLIDVNGLGRPREFSLARKRISNRGQSWREQKPGVHLAADVHSAYGPHEWRSKRHGRQLAEEPTGGMAKTAETI